MIMITNNIYKLSDYLCSLMAYINEMCGFLSGINEGNVINGSIIECLSTPHFRYEI